MSHIHELSASLDLPADVIGAKARGLVTLLRLGLPVPPAVVIDTAACRWFLRTGQLPDGLTSAPVPLVPASLASVSLAPASLVSVRSGAADSMPGMMNTLLNVPASEIPAAVAKVFASWHTPRATTYRELHGIDHTLGTAVIVQAMVFGDEDPHSSTGVAFSRDPSTGAKTVFGEVLFERQGDAVVSGESVTHPLTDLATREPAVWTELAAALALLERHYRNVCHVEFTVESGRLWFLQVRPGGLVGRAAVRAAVDLVDERLIDRPTAVERITTRDLRLARSPRIRPTPDLITRGQGATPDVLTRGEGTTPDVLTRGEGATPDVLTRGEGTSLGVLTRGLGASPGVATGRLATTADNAVRMAATGPVILVRPHTSPLDMHGLAAAAGVVTSRGGPTSHAAVVARSMAKPAVVAATALTVDEPARCVRIGNRILPEGEELTIDGAGGEVVLGNPGTLPSTEDPHLQRLLTWLP